MSSMILPSVFLMLSIWATILIVGLDRATSTQKAIYIAAIWLLPIIGAVIAYLASLRFRELPKPTSDTKMTEAVASKYRSMNSD